MATFCMSQWHDGDEVLKCYMNEDVKALKDALENLNTPKSSLRRILTGVLLKNSENSELKPTLGSKLMREWSS